MKKLYSVLVALITAFAGFTAFSSIAHAADHAVVIMYHRFGEDRYPSTNTTIPQFEAHLDELATGGYTVMPLLEITEALEAGTELPDRAVAITIDDAFTSVYEEAFPRLTEYGFPFTLFVATRAIGARGYATWDQIREMQAAGVDIGSQSHSHPHLHKLGADEVRREIETSNGIFLKELGAIPQLHAYPFGEFSPVTRDVIAETGFKAAFGQHSGVLHASLNKFEFPRFTFNETYGTLDRFRLAVNAVALPVSDVVPESIVLDETNPPFHGFTVSEGIEPLASLSCFASGMGQVKTEILSRRVEVRPPEPFANAHGRINCTMPYVLDGKNTGRWRWFSRQYIKP